MTDSLSLDRRQPPARRRFLKSGKVLLGKHPVPCTIRNLLRDRRMPGGSDHGRHSLEVRSCMGDQPARTCEIIWLDETKLGVKFIQQE